MRYDEFRDEVSENILSYMDDTIDNPSVKIIPKQQNNGNMIYGLSIYSESTPDMITPVLYLDRYYKRYEEGESIDSVMKQLARDYADVYKNREIDETHVHDYLEYDFAKDHIVPRLVNYEMNADRLQGFAHTRYLDLAVTYHVVIHVDEEGLQSIPITNDLLEKFEVTTDDLHEQAMTNLSKSEPTFHSMEEVMMRMFADTQELGDDLMLSADEVPTMLIVSNENYVYGSIEILNDSVTEEISKRFDGDFYMLPSSVHEFIAIPISSDIDPNELASMITSINETTVKHDEVLSNHAYYYDSKQHELLPIFGQSYDLSQKQEHHHDLSQPTAVKMDASQPEESPDKNQDRIVASMPDDLEPVQALEHSRRQLTHGRH